MKTPFGKVYLIGAGPGDLEYLTLKAVRVLKEADVLMLDSLVNPEIVQFARKDALVVQVGKRFGQDSTPQDVICNQMLEYAKSGLCVARVKGGDPLVFARGGEEILALTQAGIDIEIVSGITSSIAIANTLLIPLTHRDLAHGMVFITGCSKNKTPQQDWQALVKSGSTIVIYMGLTNLPEVVKGLLDAGLSPQTPSAAVQDGTLPEQQSVLTPINYLVEAVNKAKLVSPTLVIIGAVVSLSPFWKAQVKDNHTYELARGAR